ncbi:MAG: hypothetical protein Q7R96_00245 [Nanoarchaeota archaeon]|nr:hypothetical protein [Nanoarchaeota archaeon]
MAFSLRDQELNPLATRVLKLTDKEIDELWYQMGWVVSDHENYLKSLRTVDIELIRESTTNTITKIKDLLDDGGITATTIKNNLKEFKKKLELIEKRR